jgi:hypothetical protein
MADFNRLVEYLRDARQNLTGPPSDELRAAAVEFADLSRTANNRLREATMLIAQGLRTEAIALAEEPPNLLELVAALDLPDYQLWADYCQSYELPVPPPLQLDRATQLNEAYAADQPIEHLMAEHRRLNLERAPVGQRLELMRQIAAAGAGGPNWDKDLRAFETARLREMPTEFYDAVKARDELAIESLRAQIQDQPWLEKVPDDLQKAVDDASKRMRSARITTELRGLVEPLRQAFANGDEGTCLALLERWNELLTAAGMTQASSELQMEIEPVEHFLTVRRNERKHAHHVAQAQEKLTAALAADAPTEPLTKTYQAALALEDPLPPALEARYHAVIDARDRAITSARKQKRFLAIGGISLVVLAAGAGAYLYTNTQSANRWAKQIEAAVHAGDVTRAQQIADEQRKQAPQLNNAAVIIDARRDLDLLVQQAQDDQHHAAAIADAEKTLADQISKQVQPDNTSPTDLAAAYSQIAATMASDDQQLPRAAQNTASAPARQQLIALQSTIRDRLDSLVGQDLAALGRTLDATDTGHSAADASAAAGKIEALIAHIEPMSRWQALSPDTRMQVNDLLDRARQKHDASDQNRIELADLRTLRDAAATSDQLTKAITAFLARYPNSPQTDDLTRALKNLPAVKSMEAWRDLLATFGNVYTIHDAAAATQRIQSIATYLQTYPQSPMTPVATRYSDYLKQAQGALADKNTWQAGLDDLLQNPLITDLAYIDLSDGNRYYILGDPKMTERRLNNLRSFSFEALDPKDIAHRKVISVDPPIKLLNNEPIKVPHTALASALNDSIKKVDESNWLTVGPSLVDTIVNAEDSNIVVRAVLLQAVIKCNAQAYGWAIDDSYDRALHDLARQKPEELIWYDPDRPLSQGTVNSLHEIFGAVPKATDIAPKIAAAQTALFKSLQTDPINTGVLLRSDAGLTVQTIAPAADGNVAVAVTPHDNAPATLDTIATNHDGIWQMQDTTLPEGTMILILGSAP